MLTNLLRPILFGTLVGLISGSSVSFFISTLEAVVRFHSLHLELSLGLPFVGLLLGWMRRYFEVPGKSDTGLILEEIHQPKSIFSARFGPLVYLSTLLTQFVGGSAGREGAAVQIASSLSDQLGKKFKLKPIERKSILTAGLCAGFAAALGTPFAGLLFGLEIKKERKFDAALLLKCTVAMAVSLAVARVLKTPHLTLPQFKREGAPLGDPTHLLWSVLIAVPAVLAVYAFFFISHHLKRGLQRIPGGPMSQGFVGGSLLSLLFLYPGFNLYHGLGIDGILASFTASGSPWIPALKLIFTAITLASGFKGGEFIPLIFVGSTLGSALSVFAGLGFTFLPALGCVAVFGAAARAPLTCTILAYELFGPAILPYAAISVTLTHFLSGKKSLYST